jgi:hypothetical protein
MPEMDHGIKRLLQSHPRDVLALALPGAVYEGTLPVDVATEPQLVLDTLLRIRYEGAECAMDVEAEARPRPAIGRRLFEYGARASIVTGLPVISVVLWLEPDGKAPASPYELRAGSRLVATWEYIGIEVYRLPAEELIARGLVGLLPLVPFTRDGQNLTVVERAADVVKERTAGQERDELGELLAVFAARNLGADIGRAIFRRMSLSTEILEQSPLYQEWIRDAKEQGRQEGRQEGVAEGLRQAALTMLRGRFGELSPEVVAALSAADQGALDALLPQLGTITMDELQARLGLA